MTLRETASLDCQPKSQEDAVYVSRKWRDGVLASLAAPEGEAVAYAVLDKYGTCCRVPCFRRKHAEEMAAGYAAYGEANEANGAWFREHAPYRVVPLYTTPPAAPGGTTKGSA